MVHLGGQRVRDMTSALTEKIGEHEPMLYCRISTSGKPQLREGGDLLSLHRHFWKFKHDSLTIHNRGKHAQPAMNILEARRRSCSSLAIANL